MTTGNPKSAWAFPYTQQEQLGGRDSWPIGAFWVLLPRRVPGHCTVFGSVPSFSSWSGD